ncbi:MAG: hypothetical protein PHQ36_04270, partial [Anaerolineales bacterium]|nr:hypothetical protein [Anaerolineales bacterium]
MKYITPITDRTVEDIANKTAKAFFNVLDWHRIHNNTQVTKALMDFLYSISVPQESLIEPTIVTVPTIAELNSLLKNIEEIRIHSNLPAISG